MHNPSAKYYIDRMATVKDPYDALSIIQNLAAVIKPADTRAANQAVHDMITRLLKPSHKHKKRGTSYSKMGSVVLQTETPLEDNATAILYRDTKNGQMYVRPATEFNDGRFEELK